MWTSAAGLRMRPAPCSIRPTRRTRKRSNTRFAPQCARSKMTTMMATTITTREGRPLSLAIDPVRQLHQEAVIGSEIEQIVHVAAEGPRALEPCGPLATLAPNDEQCGPRAVLPPEHDVGAELLEVEPADVVRVRGVAVRLIAAHVVRRARRGRQLAHVAERPFRDEGLRVHLERHVRGERIREP